MNRSRFAPKALLVLGILAAYSVFRAPLIESIYSNHAPRLLSVLIRHKEIHPVGHYLYKMDAAFLKIILFAVLFYVLWRALRIWIPDTVKRCFLFFMGSLLIMILSSRPNGHDCAQHLAYFQEVLDGFQNGSFRIFFSRSFDGAPGLPVFVFYSPWNYALPAVFRSMGFEPFLCLKLAFCLLYAVHARFVHLVLKKVLSPAAAACGTLLYVTSNYFLCEYFVRFAFAEFGGYTFCIIGFYFLLKFSENFFETDFLLAAIAWSVALLLHPIGFAYFYPGAAIFLLFARHDRRAPAGKILRSAALLATVTLIALSVSSFQWLPILIERAEVVGNSMRLSDTFFFPGSLLSIFGPLSPGIVITVALVIATARTAAAFGKKHAADGIQMSSFVCIVLYFFFMSRISDPFHVGLMRDSQLSWRMLIPFTLFSVILIGKAIPALRMQAAGIEKIKRFACAALLLQGFCFVYINASSVLFVPSDNTPRQSLRDFRNSGTGRTGFIEFMPSAKNASSNCTAQAVILGRRLTKDGEQLDILPVSRKAEYCLDRIWFHWLTAVVEGSPRPVSVNHRGFIVLPLNEGERRIDIRETKPFYVSLSEKVSLALFLVLWLGLAAAGLLRHRRSGRKDLFRV